MKPILDRHNVRFVGVGVEELGVEEFVAGKFFDGELYVDTKKQSYAALGFKRYNMLNVFGAVLSSAGRSAYAKAKEMNLGGNMSGDGYQNGGTLVVDKGGKLLLFYKQEDASEHVAIEDVLKALNIEETVPPASEVKS